LRRIRDESFSWPLYSILDFARDSVVADSVVHFPVDSASDFASNPALNSSSDSFFQILLHTNEEQTV
jgi:hypothetical protein